VRAAWLFVIAGCGRMGFDTRATGDATDATSGADVGGPDAPPDAMITPGTMTVGFPQVGASTQNTSADRVWMSKFTLAQPGTLQRLVAYAGIGGGQPANLRGVIYADSAGTPTSLVVATPGVALAAQMPAGWVSLPLASSQALAAATYWIGVQTDSAVQIAYQVTVGATKNSLDSYANGLDATYAGGTQTFTMQLSVYGEYIP